MLFPPEDRKQGRDFSPSMLLSNIMQEGEWSKGCRRGSIAEEMTVLAEICKENNTIPELLSKSNKISHCNTQSELNFLRNQGMTHTRGTTLLPAVV